MRGLLLFLASLGAAVVSGSQSDNSECPGYTALNIKEQDFSLTADLVLAGDPCNSYGLDLPNLKLLVEYQTGPS